MSVVHRKGNRYRAWHSFGDRYCTWPMSRAEMAALLFSREFSVGFTPTAREVARAKDAIEERLERAGACGTSARNSDGSFCARRTDAWEDERCAYCESFHHAYEPKPGGCASCGEGKCAPGHKRPCAHHAGEQPCRWVPGRARCHAQAASMSPLCRRGLSRGGYSTAAWAPTGACVDAGAACEARPLP